MQIKIMWFEECGLFIRRFETNRTPEHPTKITQAGNIQYTDC